MERFLSIKLIIHLCFFTSLLIRTKTITHKYNATPSQALPHKRLQKYRHFNRLLLTSEIMALLSVYMVIQLEDKVSLKLFEI